jgi:hypothetical protein
MDNDFETSGLACKQPEPYDYRPQWAREGLALPISTQPRKTAKRRETDRLWQCQMREKINA